MSADITYLNEMAKLLRKDVIEMVYQAGEGHPGPALSVADIIASLYFGIMRVDPSNPHWSKRDCLVLSKGHACPVLYAALARKGFFSINEYPTLRSLNSILQGHPDMKKTPGIDSTSGSLGDGISIRLGMAVAGEINNEDYFTYVITGDGELEEGIIWEATMAAKQYKIGRIIVFVDHNKWQSGRHC